MAQQLKTKETNGQTILAKCCLGATFGQNFDFKIRWDNQKSSYERRVYESVDDDSLS